MSHVYIEDNFKNIPHHNSKFKIGIIFFFCALHCHGFGRWMSLCIVFYIWNENIYFATGLCYFIFYLLIQILFNDRNF